jgi:hypothetical protein
MSTPRFVTLTSVTLAFTLLLGAPGCSARKEQPARAPEAPGSSTEAAPAESEKTAAPAAEGAPASDMAPSAPAAGAGMPHSAVQKDKGAPVMQEKRRVDAPDEIETLGRALEGALALAAPDCTTAWSLRDRICDLSQRLCDIAGRSAEPDVAERCTDGRSRCERATARVRAACAE